MKLFRAQAAAGQGAPGEVVQVDARGLHVGTSDGLVVIRELQAPGRKRLAAAQFASGRGVAVGDVLSPPEAK